MSFNPRKRQRHSPDPADYPFVFFGTPLPPLDPDVRDDGTYVPLWKQEVRDERGRKRLHGAFTGGFSAGYFNTVGSKEGWTPATFTSSRTNRAKQGAQTVEDFMDEEDLAELAESQQVSTKSQFEGLGSTADEMQNRTAGDLFDELLRPKEDTIGAQILRKMGWREGQGIGPRVHRKLADEGEDEAGATYNLAPVNIATIILEPKKDVHGLGYAAKPGLERRIEKPVKKAKSVDTKIGMRGSMGIGVLNEDDDEDPYDVGLSRDQYSKTVVSKRDTSETPTFKASAKHTFTARPKPSTTSTSSASSVRRGHDGRLPLPGFSLSESPFTLTTEWFHSPEIPEDYTPQPPILGAPPPGPSTQPQPQLAPKDRGEILGETPLAGKSVFAFLTPEARARISAATGKTNLPPALNEASPATSKPRVGTAMKGNLPNVPKETAVAALSGGFMPYGDNPDKQKRYRAYLELMADLSERPLTKPPDLRDDEWNKEIAEFVRAAMVFKPMSRLMASRFTSSSTTLPASSETNAPILSVPTEKPEDPAIAAAKLNMYGHMTRSVTDFYPTRLLCKRFNVKDPHPVPAAEEEGKETAAADVSLINADAVKELKREARGAGTYDLAPIAAEESVEVHADRNEVLEGERAGEEVFKSIFGDDSDEE